MKAAVVREFGRPLQVGDVAVPVPGHGQVLVEIETSGLCHTDIHAAHGDWPIKPALPFVPGHEGVGLVERLGPGVKNLSEGDRVAVPRLGWGCGACEQCASGWETLCPLAKYTGYSVDGGFAEYVLAEAAFAGRVPAGVDPVDAAPLTCAGGHDVQGGGGVGGTFFGPGGGVRNRRAGPSGLAVRPDRRSDRRCGRRHRSQAGVGQAPRSCLYPEWGGRRSRGGDPGARGADAAIVLAATPRAYEQAFASLRPNGTLVGVGLPADNTMHLPIFQTVLKGIKVVGSLVGTRVDLAETFELHADGRTSVVAETRHLEQVNEAIAEVEQGTVEARLVFDLRS